MFFAEASGIEMSFDGSGIRSAIQILLPFIPGALVMQTKAFVARRRTTVNLDFFLCSFLYGLLAYVLYAIYLASLHRFRQWVFNIPEDLAFPESTRVFLFSQISGQYLQGNIFEVIRVSILGCGLGFCFGLSVKAHMDNRFHRWVDWLILIKRPIRHRFRWWILQRRIPILTQAEVESIRTPDDITRIVQAHPEREYQIVRGGTPETKMAAEPPEVRKRRHSAILSTICLGAAGYAFGISSASCMIHLTARAAILVAASAVAFGTAGWWAYRSRR